MMLYLFLDDVGESFDKVRFNKILETYRCRDELFTTYRIGQFIIYFENPFNRRVSKKCVIV